MQIKNSNVGLCHSKPYPIGFYFRIYNIDSLTLNDKVLLNNLLI